VKRRDLLSGKGSYGHSFCQFITLFKKKKKKHYDNEEKQAWYVKDICYIMNLLAMKQIVGPRLTSLAC
jgi:hypothetical protein